MLGPLLGRSALSVPRWLRECLILLVFYGITALMTWPWVTRLRDAVYDNGDSYAFAWSLWWNFHQTFNDPLNLFHANIFFPYRYTLAFTEHNFGIAVLCFPLFALGLRPLTVLSVATFSGFALCGYSAFRLARTLTGSYGIAWVAGVIFAYIPYRFMLLPHLPYLFAAWIPLLLEALVLFVYVRSWRRSLWLGVTFLMNGLTCISWLMLSLLPLALSVAVLVIRNETYKDKRFWIRGSTAVTIAGLLLVPFLLPYHYANKLYGFNRSVQEVAQYSASLVDWVAAPALTKVWAGMGVGLPGVMSTLFPGLLVLLLSLLAVVLTNSSSTNGFLKSGAAENKRSLGRMVVILDAIAIASAVMAIISAGFSAAPAGTLVGTLAQVITSDRALLFFTLAMLVRFSISYPAFLRRINTGRNLVESLRSKQRDDAFWLGVIWASCGFVLSFGMSTFLYRVLYDLVLPFRSLRAPSRAAMTCYVGLALLGGLGAARLNSLFARWRVQKSWVIYSTVVIAILFELHAAPLPFIRGAVFPDAVSVHLKKTPMHGAVVDLPSLPDPPHYTWHLSMLRAADHQRPVVFAAASFYPTLTIKLHELTQQPEISSETLDVLEAIPASYVVVRWGLIGERRAAFQRFLGGAMQENRLRFVGTFGEDTDLYAVAKTEPTVAEIPRKQ